jgi:hypothetical protein
MTNLHREKKKEERRTTVLNETTQIRVSRKDNEVKIMKVKAIKVSYVVHN